MGEALSAKRLSSISSFLRMSSSMRASDAESVNPSPSGLRISSPRCDTPIVKRSLVLMSSISTLFITHFTNRVKKWKPYASVSLNISHAYQPYNPCICSVKPDLTLCPNRLEASITRKNLKRKQGRLHHLSLQSLSLWERIKSLRMQCVSGCPVANY